MREIAVKGGYGDRVHASARVRATAFVADLERDFDMERISRDDLWERLVAAFMEAARDGLRAAGSRGGAVNLDRHGHEHFVEIGKKGGKRVRELIAAGRKAEVKR